MTVRVSAGARSRRTKDPQQEVRRQLGTALGAKGSRRFGLTTARRLRRSRATRSIVAQVVVEFTDAVGNPAYAPANHGRLLESLSSAAQEIRAAGLGGAPASATALLRPALVAAADFAFQQLVHDVVTTVERYHGGRPAARSGAPRTGLETCWLNHTVRLRAPLELIAEIAGDDAVVRIDVPRRLRRLAAAPPSGNARDRDEESGEAGSGVRVAVLDGEVCGAHPALGRRVLHRMNLTDEAWGRPDRHATAVAGIIAGGSPDYRGRAGAAEIVNYKIFPARTTDGAGDPDDFDAVLALQSAVDDGMTIANCSWCGDAMDEVPGRHARAVDRAWDLGLIVVTSAGNDGPAAGTMTTPAEADKAIVVGATDPHGTAVQAYSSRGPVSGKAGPTLVAPGGGEDAGLVGCLPDGTVGDVGYGTSYAAAYVTGLLAALLGRYPEATPGELRDRLLGAARLLPGFGPEAQGAGVVR